MRYFPRTPVDPIERVLMSVLEQVVSVCLGIDHMMKRRRMGRVGSRASYGTVHSHAGATTANATAPAAATASAAAISETAAKHERDHLASCRLCESTMRVLSIARTHGKRRHRDGSDCGACGVWAKVMTRCASLGIIAANVSSAWLGVENNGLLTVGVGVIGSNGAGGGGHK